jgi:peptide/nickel transport system substrate-binding protein
MNTKYLLLAGASLLGAAALAMPASAQKSKDTLRAGFYQPTRLVDPYFFPAPEASLVTRMVFDSLVNYDAVKRKYVPAVAESWKRIGDTTMEFKLRKDIKFSDGEPLDADDALYTYKFWTNPKVKFRFKRTRINWYDTAKPIEKIDKYTVRIHSKQPMAVMLGKLNNFPSILPQHIHGKLAKKNTFGQKAVGSGPYKVTKFNASKGLTLVRNDRYKHGNIGKPAGIIKTIDIKPVPDQQTQIARLLVGEQDLVYNVDKDSSLELGKFPDFRVSVQDSVSFVYVMFDAADRS